MIVQCINNQYNCTGCRNLTIYDGLTIGFKYVVDYEFTDDNGKTFYELKSNDFHEKGYEYPKQLFKTITE